MKVKETIEITASINVTIKKFWDSVFDILFKMLTLKLRLSDLTTAQHKNDAPKFLLY